MSVKVATPPRLSAKKTKKTPDKADISQYLLVKKSTTAFLVIVILFCMILIIVSSAWIRPNKWISYFVAS
jgi:hypothetical protein